MILTPNDAAVAYRCPFCGEYITSIVGIFSLSGEFIRLKCPCQRSELKVTKLHDGKIKLSVPCLVCESTHDFTISQSALFSSDAFSFACPCSSFDICFVGKEDKVEEAIVQNKAEFDKLLADNELDESLFFGDEEEDEDEPEIDFGALAMTLSVVKELLADGKVICSCPDEKTDIEHEHSTDFLTISGDYENNCKGKYVVELIDGEFVLICTECGKKYTLPSNPNSAMFDSFISTDFIYLL